MRKTLLTIVLVIFISACGSGSTPKRISIEALNIISSTTTTTTTIITTIPSTTITIKAKSLQQPSRSVPRSSAGIPGVCGGVLPPCWVLDRESGHNDGNPNTYDVHAYNPSGCSGRGCYGKWQCDPNSCNGTGTEEQQNAEAARLWDNGRGCSHWNAC